MMNVPPAPMNDFGIYVHVPWCRARCPYCAFNVAVQPDPPFAAWQTGIQAAWDSVATDFEGTAASLYFGGGTPSLMPPGRVSDVINSLPLHSNAEVTLEVNPGTATTAQLCAFKDAGINRISMGIQSFQARVARRLGRGHTIGQARQLVDSVAEIGFRSWSLDLIFGVPDQTMDELTADLRQIRAARPPHISLYGLTIEPGTPFSEARAAGRLPLPSSEQWRAMYDRIVHELEADGWQRYEVSNFALPGHEGRHNEDVWRGGHYAGLGPGAHGFHPCGARTTSEADINQWLRTPQPGRAIPSALEAATDMVLTTLRHRAGLDLAQLSSRTGHALPTTPITHLVEAGLLVQEQSRIRLTSDGYPVADGIVRQLSSLLEPFPS